MTLDQQPMTNAEAAAVLRTYLHDSWHFDATGTLTNELWQARKAAIERAVAVLGTPTPSREAIAIAIFEQLSGDVQILDDLEDADYWHAYEQSPENMADSLADAVLASLRGETP